MKLLAENPCNFFFFNILIVTLKDFGAEKLISHGPQTPVPAGGWQTMSMGRPVQYEAIRSGWRLW